MEAVGKGDSVAGGIEEVALALALVVGAGQGLRGHLEADAVKDLVALPAYSAGFAIDCWDDAVDL